MSMTINRQLPLPSNLRQSIPCPRGVGAQGGKGPGNP